MAGPDETRASIRLSEIDWRGAWQRLVKRDLRQTALIAFAVGILFHACVAFAVLGGGGGDSSSANKTIVSPPANPNATATATVLPDRQNCAAIAGTSYRSDAERAWYLRNCIGP